LLPFIHEHFLERSHDFLLFFLPDFRVLQRELFLSFLPLRDFLALLLFLALLRLSFLPLRDFLQYPLRDPFLFVHEHFFDRLQDFAPFFLPDFSVLQRDFFLLFLALLRLSFLPLRDFLALLLFLALLRLNFFLVDAQTGRRFLLPLAVYTPFL
jgi:hypothetical protein